MTCNRAKNSMTEEVVNWEIPLHVGLWGWEFFKSDAGVSESEHSEVSESRQPGVSEAG